MFECGELPSRGNEVLRESIRRPARHSPAPAAPRAAPFTTSAASTPTFVFDVHVDPKDPSGSLVLGA